MDEACWVAISSIAVKVDGPSICDNFRPYACDWIFVLGFSEGKKTLIHVKKAESIIITSFKNKMAKNFSFILFDMTGEIKSHL